MGNAIKVFTESRHFTLDTVTEGVYAAIAAPGTGSVGNAAIIDLGDSLLVIDTFNTIEAAEDLLKVARSLNGKQVSYVLNTHWHGDHTSGNQVFASEAAIISTKITYDIMADFGRKRLNQHLADSELIYQGLDEEEEQAKQEKNQKLKRDMQWDIASNREYMNMLPQLDYTLPALTFDKELTIHSGTRTVQILTFGGGHTESDAFVYLPEEKIAVTGDLVLSKHHPVLMNSNPKEWLNILEKLARMEIKTIIPGHGEVCSKQQLHEVKEYIQAITALVEESAENKESLEAITVPEAYQDWCFTNYFQLNLNRIYDFMEKKG